MKRRIALMLLGGVLLGSSGWASDIQMALPAEPPPAPPQVAPLEELRRIQTPEVAVGLPVPATPMPPGVDVRRRRDAIMLMEGVLATAVRLGAEAVASQIQAVQPGLGMFTTSVARARGVYLEGYGVFFHVEIPTVRPSVVNMIEALARERVQQGSAAIPSAAGRTAMDPGMLTDPDTSYVLAVKAKLIDAMVDYSKSLDLQPDEWLTLAARGDGVPVTPGEIFETRTMILRVRGADLTDFLSGRLSRDEIRRRVQLREF